MAGELTHIIPTHPSDSQWRARQTSKILYVDPNGNQHNIKAVYWSDSNKQTHLIWMGNLIYNFANCYNGASTTPAFIFNVTEAAHIQTITIYTAKSFNNIQTLILAKYDGDIDSAVEFRNALVKANNTNFSIVSSTKCSFKTQDNKDIYETILSYNDNTGLLLDEGNYYLAIKFDYSTENYLIGYDNITNTKARIFNTNNMSTNVNSYMWTQSYNYTPEIITNEFVKYTYTSSSLQWDETPYNNCWVEWNLYDETKNELLWNTYSYYPSHTATNKQALKINSEIDWWRLYSYGRSYKNNITNISASQYFAPEGMRFASVETCKNDVYKGGWRYPYDVPDDQVYKSCIDTYQYTQVNKSDTSNHYPFILYTPTTNCKLVSVSYLNHHNIAENSPQNVGVVELNTSLKGVNVLGQLNDNSVSYYKKTNVITGNNTTKELTLYKHYRLPTSQINLQANKTYAISISNEYDNEIQTQTEYSKFYQYYRTNAVNTDGRHYTVCKVDPWNPTSNPVTVYSYSAYAIITTAAL